MIGKLDITLRVESISQRLENIQKRAAAAALRSGRNPAEARLVAVSKTFGPEAVCDAANAGLTVFGENKVQEALLALEQGGAIVRHSIVHSVRSVERHELAGLLCRFQLEPIACPRLGLLKTEDRQPVRIARIIGCAQRLVMLPALLVPEPGDPGSAFGAATIAEGTTL